MEERNLSNTYPWLVHIYSQIQKTQFYVNGTILRHDYSTIA